LQIKKKGETRALPKEASGKQKTAKWIFYSLLATAVATCCSISLLSANLDVALPNALMHSENQDSAMHENYLT